MAGTIIDMSKIKQLLHLKKAGVSNMQIAKDLKMSRDHLGYPDFFQSALVCASHSPCSVGLSLRFLLV